MSHSKRLFLAIHIKPKKNFVDIFSDLKNELSHENLKWVKIENLHLTLRFLGETNSNLIQDIILAIRKSMHETFEFETSIQNIGVFGSRYQPKVLWFGFKNDERLKALEESINKGFESIGLKRDRQNFVPHLTVTRIKQLKDKELFFDIISEYKDEFIQDLKVEEIILFESILERSGAVYNIVERFPLKKA